MRRGRFDRFVDALGARVSMTLFAIAAGIDDPKARSTISPPGLWRWLMPIAVLAYLAAAALLIGHTADDSYISLRYARHLVEGHGLVWNPGEPVPVEGYSNLLWVLLMAAFEWLAPASAMLLAKLVGLAGGLVCVLLTARLARAWGVGSEGQGWAALFLAASPAFVFWAGSGMETSCFAAALLGAVLLLRTRRAWYPVAMVAASLLRPEGPYLFVVLWAWRLGTDIASGERRTAIRLAVRDGAVFTALFGPYLLWRWVHYGSWVPNSVHAKFQLFSGVQFLLFDCAQYFAVHIIAAIMVASVAALATMPRRDRLPLVLLPLAVALPLINCRPVMGYYFRFFWPVLPLLFVCSALVLEELRRRWGRTPMLLAAVALTLYPLLGLGPILSTARSQATITQQVLHPLVQFVRAHGSSEVTLAMSDCGIVPYLSRAQVIDLWGLNDREIARDGFWVERVVARQPDLFVLVSRSGDRFDPLFAWEGALAEDDGFKRDYRLARVFSAPAPIAYHSWVFERAARGTVP